jgi:parallel beta-helix repeat protein
MCADNRGGNGVRRRRIAALLGVVAVAAVAATMVLGTSAGTATGPCDMVAAPGGSDGNAGTLGSPFRSVQKLSDELDPGDVGCLRTGTYTGNIDVTQGGTSEAGVTIQSHPGEEATVVGRIVVERTAPFVTFTQLRLNGIDQGDDCEPDACPSPTVNADDVTFSYNDVTNEHVAICFLLGDAGGVFGRADDVRIIGNRIHDCGVLPRNNTEHGIYAQATRGAEIVGNYIYDNADKGILLYPDADRATITHNVITRNGTGVHFGGDEELVSDDNTIERNVISDAQEDWNISSFYDDEGPVGEGNVVNRNCLYASNEDPFFNRGGGDEGSHYGYWGYTVSENVIADAPGVGYVDAETDDFRLRASSDCASLFSATAAVSLSTTAPLPPLP